MDKDFLPFVPFRAKLGVRRSGDNPSTSEAEFKVNLDYLGGQPGLHVLCICIWKKNPQKSKMVQDLKTTWVIDNKSMINQTEFNRLNLF